MQGKILKLSDKVFAPLSIKTSEGKMLYAEYIGEITEESAKIRFDIRDIKSNGKVIYRLVETNERKDIAAITNRWCNVVIPGEDGADDRVVGTVSLCWDSAMYFKNLRIVLVLDNIKYTMYYFNMGKSGIKLPIYCEDKQVGLAEKLMKSDKGHHSYELYGLKSVYSDIVILMTSFFHITRVEIPNNLGCFGKSSNVFIKFASRKPDNIIYNFDFKDKCQ